MFITILNLLFLLFVLGITNIAYKGRAFDKTSWNRVAMLSGLLVICSFILLGIDYRKLFITLNPVTAGALLIVTFIWLFFPKMIRLYGKYPSLYLKDKKRNVRFMVRFEYPSMTIKYFEVLFQQATFLFLIFTNRKEPEIVLIGLSNR